MWRACFLAIGMFCVILGAEALVIDKVVMAADRPASTSDVPGEIAAAPKEYKPHECGEAFASMLEAIRDASVEVVFSSKKHVDGLDRQYFLRTGLVSPFLAAAREMNDRGWVMIVEDAFRDRRMQSRLWLKSVGAPAP